MIELNFDVSFILIRPRLHKPTNDNYCPKADKLSGQNSQSKVHQNTQLRHQLLNQNKKAQNKKTKTPKTKNTLPQATCSFGMTQMPTNINF